MNLNQKWINTKQICYSLDNHSQNADKESYQNLSSEKSKTLTNGFTDWLSDQSIDFQFWIHWNSSEEDQ